MRQRNRLGHPTKRHVVRVTVLGLSGITVQRHKCRDVRSHKPHYPAPPSQMQALVAFTSTPSSNSKQQQLQQPTIKGRTEVSYCLEGKSSILSSGSRVKLQKHVAVWGRPSSDEIAAQQQNQSLGSVVTFEDCLLPRGKSFGLTIAIAEEGSDIALPVGVSNIQLNGMECQEGHALTLHVPVLPNQNEKGLTPLPMIAVPQQQNQRGWKKKSVRRNRVKRLPSAPKQAVFQQVYGISTSESSSSNKNQFSNQQPVLRILLEVYEKGSELERHFVGKRLQGEQVDAVPGSIPTIVDPSKIEVAEEQEEPAVVYQHEGVVPLNDTYTMAEEDPVAPPSPSKTINSSFSNFSTSVESRSSYLESQVEEEDESCWGSETVDDTSKEVHDNIQIVHDDVETITSTIIEESKSLFRSCLPMMQEDETTQPTPTWDFTLLGRKFSIPTCANASF